MGSEAPERLFYAAMLRDVFRVFAELSRGRGILDGLDPDVFGSAPEMIAVTFDARPYIDRKLAALAAHRSAFGVTDDMVNNPPPAVAQMLQAFRPVWNAKCSCWRGRAVRSRGGRWRISSRGWRPRRSIERRSRWRIGRESSPTRPGKGPRRWFVKVREPLHADTSRDAAEDANRNRGGDEERTE